MPPASKRPPPQATNNNSNKKCSEAKDNSNSNNNSMKRKETTGTCSHVTNKTLTPRKLSASLPDDVDNNDGLINHYHPYNSSHNHHGVEHLDVCHTVGKNNQEDGDGDSDGCLHCQQHSSTEKQVRCDECQSYICTSCHWCHEYQANHEIRVCDRCDAFYCRNCDEMDQCDDCGEVVCASCSTLLSCKFCGGGLCEECATACGRCGIVLCSRDAKFAVDCDTCRLSYCLVCLASGSKDPCVRCGHRPSKRMEQLVHLRLKSIYKAFKQSSKSPKNSNGLHEDGSGGGPLNSHHHLHQDHHRYDSGPTIEELEDGMEDYIVSAVDASTPDGLIVSHLHRRKPGGGDLDHSFAEVHASQNVLSEKFLEAKQKEADAAAEALLAELQEEEEAATKKKSKKKRKKERQQKAKQKEDGDDDDEEEEVSSPLPPKVQEDSKASPTATPPSQSTTARGGAKKEPPHQKRSARTPTKAQEDNDDSATNIATSEELTTTIPPTSEVKVSPAGEDVDPFERRLYECVEEENADGIEAILFELKGVPGRSVLRKNAKKALKRLRTPATTATEEEEQALEEASLSCPMDTGNKGPVELLKLISDNTIPGKLSNRAECVMLMSPVVVGWVIGKGGQRIRDLMEESGAKVWIDQDKAKPDEARNVYIGGERKSVDRAVRMVREIVSKAPIEGASKYAPEYLESEEVSNERSSPPVDSPQEAATRPPYALPSATVPVPLNTEIHAPSPPLQPTASSLPIPAPSAPSSFLENVNEEDNFEYVMTCEARFVPLLIGKRGWAIKDIQDKSGARVDIDQTVTPRQIRISGLKASVEKAIPMVRDVLSYPHAQPHPGADLHDGLEQLLGVADVLNNQEASPAATQTENRPHTPPPYSYITTGDAKSAISASSSLSSTPEPSKAPAVTKGIMPLLATGSLIPPPDYNTQMHAQAQQRSQFLAQDMARGDRGTFGTIPPQSIYGGGGLLGIQHLPGLGLPPTHPGHGPAPGGVLGHHMVQNQSSPAEFVPRGMVSPSSTKAIHGSHVTGHGFGMIGQQAGHLGIPQQHLHLPPQHVPMGHYDAMPLAPSLGGGLLPPQGGAGAYDRRGMNPLGRWDHQPLPGRDYLSSQGISHGTNIGDALPPSHLGLGMAGSNMMRPPDGGLNRGANHSSVPLGGGFDMGRSLGMEGVPSATFPPVTATGPPLDSIRDEALIESLFGPSNNSSAERHKAHGGAGPAHSLLLGLDGLSLGVNDGLVNSDTAAGTPIGGGETGLWGSSLPDWNPVTGAASNALDPNATFALNDSAIKASFQAAVQPVDNLFDHTQQHPPHSRFDWGSTNAY